MKYLLLFLIVFNVEAGIKERFEALGITFRRNDIGEGEGDIIRQMRKCGYNMPNKKIFMKFAILNNDFVKLDCLELKDIEVKQEDKDVIDSIQAKKDDLAEIKALIESIPEPKAKRALQRIYEDFYKE